MRRGSLLAVALALPGLGLMANCGPETVRVDVPTSYREAQTATPAELVELVNQYAGIKTLTVSRFSAEFTGGSLEKGYLKEYPRAKGYLVAESPDSIFLNILNPLTSSTVVTMAATEGRFQIWVPRENKYLVGPTDLKLEEREPLQNVRPDHMLQALMVQPVRVDPPNSWLVVAEEQDSRRKFYTLDVIRVAAGTGVGCLQRRIWIERSELRLARQHYYDCGQPVSLIQYGGAVPMGEQLVSTEVTLERVQEHYRMHLRWEPEAVRVNQTLKETAFQVPRPPRAELVEITDGPESEPPPTVRNW